MEIIKRVWSWINAFVFWLLDARRLLPIPILAVVLLVLVVGFLLPVTVDDSVRYSGLVLQLLGIYTIVHGLLGRQRLFNHPGFGVKFRAWLRQFPWGSKKPQPIEISPTGGISLSSAGKLSIWHGVPDEASIEDRLAALEANLETLKTELAETSNEHQGDIRRLVEAAASERQMRDSAVRDIRSQMEELGAGGLRLEWKGVWWLILGTIFVSIPSEIAWVVQIFWTQ